MHGFFTNDVLVLGTIPSEVYSATFVSIIFFVILGIVSRAVLSRFPVYNSLTEKQQGDWISRIRSTVNAFVYTGMAIYLLFIDRDIWTTIYDGSFANECPRTIITMSFALAYFLVDTAYVIVYDRDVPTMLHHFSSIIISIVIFLYHKGATLYLIYGITEASTPIVNLRSKLHDANMKETLIYKINGIAMWLAWIIFRLPLVIWIPYLAFVYGWSVMVADATYISFFSAWFVYGAISCLNIYWFYLITKGLLKALGIIKPTVRATGKPTRPSAKNTKPNAMKQE